MMERFGHIQNLILCFFSTDNVLTTVSHCLTMNGEVLINYMLSTI